MLSNQYRILEALYPNEKKSLEERREALERGFELHYEEYSQHIYDDSDCMTVGQCKEAIDILDMFSALNRAKDKTGVSKTDIIFGGFDGNDGTESKYTAYVDYYCQLDGGRFTELKKMAHFNSHSGMLDIYKRMLTEWKKSEKRYELTKEDLQRIVEARTYPGR